MVKTLTTILSALTASAFVGGAVFAYFNLDIVKAPIEKPGYSVTDMGRAGGVFVLSKNSPVHIYQIEVDLSESPGCDFNNNTSTEPFRKFLQSEFGERQYVLHDEPQFGAVVSLQTGEYRVSNVTFNIATSDKLLAEKMANYLSANLCKGN